MRQLLQLQTLAKVSKDLFVRYMPLTNFLN